MPRTPLNQAQFAGTFFAHTLHTMRYTKPPLKISQIISLLKSRNLLINDEERAAKHLKNISYFRLTGYMYHLQEKDGSHLFFDDTTFNDIILHYKFDEKLRSLISIYLERIELSMRAKISDKFSESYGFFWYNDSQHYADISTMDFIVDEIKSTFENPQDQFLKSFKNKYISESLPPSNMAVEILTFGKLARLYQGLKNEEEKREIAKEFNLPSSILSNWLRSLTIVRNICAHHSRLWNRRLSAYPPRIPNRPKYRFHGELPIRFNSSIYGTLSIIDRLLFAIYPENKFISKIILLIDDYDKTVNINHMGFPENWKTEPAWKKQ